MKPTTAKFLFIILLFAVVSRLWGLASVGRFTGDEGLNVPAAGNYTLTGHTTPDYWYHPPLKHLLLFASIKIFGDNPYGWRMRNAIFGIATVLILFFLGRELFEDDRIACVAALIVAIDPLHIILSFSTVEEIQSVFFFACSFYFTIRFIKCNSISSSILSGIFLGLTMATKWYYIPATVCLILFVLANRYRDRSLTLASFAHIVSTLGLIPFALYILSYYAWFGRGYGLIEFFQMQIDAYRELRSISLSTFNRILVDSATPLEWFVRPISLIFITDRKGLAISSYVLMNNPPVWLLALPSAAFAAYRGWKFGNRNALLVALLFLVTYGQFALVRRPIFLYSSLTCLPFLALAVSFTLVSWIDRLQRARRAYLLLLSVLLAWGLYLYPFISGKTVYQSLYSPLLAFGKVYGL